MFLCQRESGVEYHNMNKVPSKSTDGGFGRITICRKDKFIRKITVYVSKINCCPFHDGSTLIQLICHQFTGWSSREMVPYQAFTVALCFLHIDLLVVTLASFSLLSESPWHWICQQGWKLYMNSVSWTLIYEGLMNKCGNVLYVCDITLEKQFTCIWLRL